MRQAWAIIFGVVTLAGAAPAADTERGPYARIAVLRPHDGDTVDFEILTLRPTMSYGLTPDRP